MQGKVLIFSAPSGAGKTTVVKHILSKFPQLAFSISATSRPPRAGEKNGQDYFFLDESHFRKHIAAGDFIEYEEVYPGRFYGTLRSEIERIWNNHQLVVFDVDVKGGINLKKIFGNQALSVFVSPPDLKTLEERLVGRGTESPENIAVRISKAREEMSYAPEFDRILYNRILSDTLSEAEQIVKQFTEQ